MKKISLIFLVLLSFNLYGNDSLFISANNDYANKNYLSASEKYENILSYNLESVELYYNLGNSYFKLDEIHKAIYNYEKALIIDQDFTEAKENIELSKLKLIDKIDEMPELFFISIYKEIQNIFSLKIWVFITLISIWLSVIILIFNKFKKNKNNLTYLLLIISFLLLFLTNSIYNNNKNIRAAIIYSPVIEVMSAPSEESTKLFNLHIGTKVNINDQIENWVNIKLTNGKKGWVAINHLKEI